MTITLDIKPEVQAELARQAAVQGQPIEVVAAALLEDAVHLPPPSPKAPAKDMVELFAPFRGLNIEFERDKDPVGNPVVNGFLVDTNIPSELTRDQPDARVVAFIRKAGQGNLFLSVMTIGEIRKGIELLAIGQKRSDLQNWLDIDVRAWFASRSAGY